MKSHTCASACADATIDPIDKSNFIDMECKQGNFDQLLEIVKDQLALEEHQRQSQQKPQEIMRGRLEAYNKLVEQIAGTRLLLDILS